MSRSSLKRSRGFSIVAAFVFAAILAATAALVQMTIPEPAATIMPISQGAAAATDPSTTQAGTSQLPPVASPEQPPSKPGYDFLLNRDPISGKFTYYYWPVCPPDGSVRPDANFAVAGIKKGVFSVRVQIKKGEFDKDWGAGDGRCNFVPTSDNSTKYIPIPNIKWMAGDLTCEYTPGGDDFDSSINANVSTSHKVAKALPSDAITNCKDRGRVNTNPTTPTNPTPTPTNTTTAGGSCPGYPDWDYAGGPCPAAIEPAPEVAQSARTLDEAWSTKTEADAAVKECESDPKKCSQTEYDSRLDSQIDANIRLQEMAEQRLDYCNSTQGAGQGIECTKDEYKKLDEAKTAALNGLKDEQAGPSAPGQQPGPRTPAGQPAPGASTRGPGIFPTQASGPANNFGNPAMGQNGGPASPFGGQCTSGYVCQGNTLYWQSPSNYNGSASCMTQPYQQCQFGCQQPNGAVQPGQQQTTVGTIQQWLPVVQSVLSLFGGGNNNNSMVNSNLSRSCATQPQQSPYGTGTNGQPCYQPPQQPPQSQCTSGTWQPISGSQNGCTTGWQCVPNGSNGTNSGAPTAQLSCQPKVADVGMQIGFSWSCGNSTGSAGTGFDTNGQLSGNTTAVAPQPPADSNNTATYTLTCINQGVTASSQCQVQLGKPGIVLVTNPKQVKSGDTALIGWVTAGMKSCVISSPDQQDFTQKNAGSSNVNGGVTSSPITKDTTFRLDCETIGGQTKSASAVVTIN